MKILLFGGSFDPIHIGHIEAAKKAIEKLNIDKVIFIPTNQTPLKSNNLVASNKDRYNMILKSIKENKKLNIKNLTEKKGYEFVHTKQDIKNILDNIINLSLIHI